MIRTASTRLALIALLTALPFVGLAAGPADKGVTEIVVRPTEIDVKGHVNNAKYVEYLQWARWDWLDAKGLTHARLTELRTVLVTANININYRREAVQGDRLRVTVAVERIGEKSFTLRQEVVKSDGVVAADATVVMVAVDPVVRKSRLLPGELREALEEKP